MNEAPNDSRCWLLHRRPYRNSSLIVDFLSPEHGRVAAVARAGRRNHALQPFQPLQLAFRGRNELRSLSLCEPVGPPVALSGEQIYCGMYLNELLMRLLQRDDPIPGLDRIYGSALMQLAEEQVPADVTLRWFEMHLLELLGYGLSLESDADGRPIEPGSQYHYQAEQGLVLNLSGRFEGRLLLAMSSEQWDEDVRRVARDLMREALAPHLGDRPLMSRQLFRQKSRNT